MVTTLTFSLQEDFIERLYWLIRLRWIASAAVCAVVFSAAKIFAFNLPVSALYLIAAFIGGYNLIFYLWARSNKAHLPVSSNRAANLQITLDLLSLALLLHFSGGIENPFVFYFIFHMIIAGILLSRRAAFFQATFSAAVFLSVVILEYSGLIPHYCLNLFIIHCQQQNSIYIIGIIFVFVTTLYIAVYMASSISKRLRRRESELREASLLLKENDRLKSEYVLRVSHDIKEDLAAIQACLEPVSSGITGELNPKQSDLVRRAVLRTTQLLIFVRALLEITRIKLNKELQMGYFSFPDTLSGAVSNIAFKAKEKNIVIASDLEASIDKIRGVREYIQEALVNLLANSVKYTPHNGKINLEVKDKGNLILIKISDNGIGIPKGELPKIFDEFYRASNAKRVEKDGTGLGLSIVKQIIQLHKGKIQVESEEGKGSSFSIELPK